MRVLYPLLMAPPKPPLPPPLPPVKRSPGCWSIPLHCTCSGVVDLGSEERCDRDWVATLGVAYRSCCGALRVADLYVLQELSVVGNWMFFLLLNFQLVMQYISGHACDQEFLL